MAAVARRGELADAFAGETRLFRLGIAELEEIEAATGRGIFAVFDRAFSAAWTTAEVRAVLACGLKGGGLTMPEAREIVAAGTVPEMLLEAAVIARGVIGVALAPDLGGGGDAAPPKKKGGRALRTGSRSAA